MADCDNADYCPGKVQQIPIRPWVDPEIPPCYLPQQVQPKLDIHPLENLALRPSVDKFSTTKYTVAEWRANNSKSMDSKTELKADKLCVDTRLAMTSAHTEADRGYFENTERLKDRTQNIFKWKADVEFKCREISEEIVQLEEMRQRLKSTLSKMLLCESITKECLDQRASRLETDLVRDEPESELIREMGLIKEVKMLYDQALKSSEHQQKCNIEAKARIEFDWCDKCIAYETDTTNIGITRKHQTILLKPGAVRLGESLSSEEQWERQSKVNIEQCASSIQQSSNLRASINALLINAARDLRTQADRVDQRLAEKISCTDELRIQLEDKLDKTLGKLAELEGFDNELKKSLRQLELSVKVTQTRLDNRGIKGRPNVELCKDVPQVGLIDEAQALGKSIADLEKNLDTANQVRNELSQRRSLLEKEIMIKKKSLFIDRDRLVAIRSFYPSSSVLSGLG